ncbi:fumarylacetoacetase [Streptomyces sp. NPDC050560]|uniref:fumarylacetoacetase n=1 Tax=Streptomyces sp. NPDC050560 TaxID=3365630 RepID=UPI0037B3D3B2
MPQQPEHTPLTSPDAAVPTPHGATGTPKTATGASAREREDNPFELPADDPYGPHNLPYGVFSPAGSNERRIGVRIGDHVLDAGAAAGALGSPYGHLLGHRDLGPLLAAGRTAWSDVRRTLTDWVTAPRHRARLRPLLHPLSEVALHLPFDVADYVDYYSSEHHARNLGTIFRPDNPEPLMPNWKHLPTGYHGRAGTVVVSGTDVVRPSGQRRAPGAEAPSFGPSTRLDIEAEVGFVVGVPSRQGVPVPLADFREHVFGLCLLNDWSARDIQAWEYVPLGPYLGKSFATSVAAWITPLEALDAARVAPPERSHPLLPYLDDSADDSAGSGAGGPGGYDLRMSVRLNGEEISRPPFATMYWTAAQQLAHMAVGGARLRTGDLYGSGTVSGPGADERGSLIELTWNGRDPLTLADGTTRAFLEDGDEVTLTGWAPGADGTRIGLGEVTGRIVAAG